MAENYTDDSNSEDALAELNKNFRKSKVMQILRFLHDQDLLNKRFNELEMESDQDNDAGATTSDSESALTPQQRLSRLQQGNSAIDSDNDSVSSVSISRHRQSRTALGDPKHAFDDIDGQWAVASPKTSPVPPAEPRKTRRCRSKTDIEKNKRILKKLNVRPASAFGHGQVLNTHTYGSDLRLSNGLNKPKSSPSTMRPRRIDIDKPQLIWETKYSENDFMGGRGHVLACSKTGPSSITDKVSVMSMRGQPTVDPLLRGASMGGAHPFSSPYRSPRERSNRYASNQFEIHEIASLRDGNEMKTLMKSKGLTEISDPTVTAITMVKLPPLDTAKMVTGSNLVNTC